MCAYKTATTIIYFTGKGVAVAVYRVRGKWMTFCMLNQLWNVHLIIPRNLLVYLCCSTDLHFQTSPILIITSSRPPTDKKHKPPQCAALSTDVCMFQWRSMCVCECFDCVRVWVGVREKLTLWFTHHSLCPAEILSFSGTIAFFFFFCPLRFLKHNFSGPASQMGVTHMYFFFLGGKEDDWFYFSGNTVKEKHMKCF